MNKICKSAQWKKNSWILVLIAVLTIGWIIRLPGAWDLWLGLGYAPSAEVEAIQGELELTNKGKRIFAAVRPEVEASEDFNEHCDSHDADISLLGCYTEGRIYVYDITLEQLEAAKKVTMAHELLHAVWERMGEWERDEVRGILEVVYTENKEWFDEELEPYSEGERIEEIYTRTGTKLAELPEELEAHYAKVFQNRKKIVEFYEEYEAPFAALRLEIKKLEEKIGQVREEIEWEKMEYEDGMAWLDFKIEAFNDCADMAGCFKTEAEFARQRSALLAEKEELEKMRARLNEKIAENNQRVADYREKQAALGKLGDAMNSNIEDEI